MLGIEPTRDRSAIRRAYARRLKQTNPEDDPDGFQALRAAYERALAWAGGGGGLIVIDRNEHRRVADDEEGEGGEGRDERGEDEQADVGRRRRRAWRAPQDEDDEPHRDREHPWRPREPERREGKPRRAHAARREAPPPDPHEAAYSEARANLARLAADPRSSSDTLKAALEAVLGSPALHSVARHDEAEAWIAQLIHLNLPRTDPLVAPAVAFFRWNENRVGPASMVGARVSARLDDLNFLAAARIRTSPHHGALEALTRAPNGWRRRLANRLTPGLPDRVRALLAVLRAERPGLFLNLDTEAVAWWTAYLAQPRLGPLAIWSLVVLPAFFGLLVLKGQSEPGAPQDADPWAVFAATFIGVGAVVLVSLYGVQWPRKLWRERWAARAPGWARLGWAPALVATVLLAGFAPPTDWAPWAVSLAAAVLALWSIDVAEPDRREGVGRPWPEFAARRAGLGLPIALVLYFAYWGLLRPGVRFAWGMRAAFAFAYFGLFWLLAGDALSAAAFNQLQPALAGAAVAFSWGSGTLAEAWRAASRPARTTSLAGLALLAAAAAAALVAAIQIPWLRPAAVALVAAAVFAHKAPAADLAPADERARDVLMRYGWIGYLFVDALAHHRASRLPITSLLTFAIWAGFIWGVVLLRGSTPASRRQAAQAFGRGLVRYGALAMLPLLLVLAPAPGDASSLLVGGLWLLTGVAATVLGHVPAPARARRGSPVRA